MPKRGAWFGGIGSNRIASIRGLVAWWWLLGFLGSWVLAFLGIGRDGEGRGGRVIERMGVTGRWAGGRGGGDRKKRERKGRKKKGK